MCLESGCPNFLIFVVSLSPSKANAATVPEITVRPLSSHSFPFFSRQSCRSALVKFGLPVTSLNKLQIRTMPSSR
jgi:hypothetical protein